MDGSYFIELMGNYGYIGLVLGMLLEGFIIIIPSEIILIFAGILVAQGIFTMPLAIFYGVFGSVLCALILYGFGYFGGRPFIVKYGKYFFINDKDLAKADKWFLKYGMMAAFFGRCFPIIRTFISLPIGIAKLDWKKFTFYTTLGSIPWTMAFIYGGYALGENASIITEYVNYLKLPIIIIGVLLVLTYIYFHLKKE